MYSRKSLRFRILLGLLVLGLLVAPVTAVLAAPNPSGTGQPDVECEDFSSVPGHSDSNSGSAFAEDGRAGTVYAGAQPQNSLNEHSESRYDVACFQVSQH